MQFYSISDNSVYSPQWARAWKIIPSLTTLGVLCDVCGKGRLYPDRYLERPLTTEIEGRAKYPDVLGCAAPLFVVSEHILGDWMQNDISGFKPFPLHVIKPANLESENALPPNYFHLKIMGRCQLDLEAMGIQITYVCPKCGYRNEDLTTLPSSNEDFDPFNNFGFVIKEDTWDGSDLFVSELFDGVKFCSERVFHLAGLYKHTNFRFLLLEDCGNGDEPGIDYIK